MAEDTTTETEDIIDLTELIEQGQTESEKIVAQKDAEERQSLDSKMQELNTPTSKDEDEIDALLKQIGDVDPADDAPPGHDLTNSEVTAPGHLINANEQLDMSGMNAVDNLLDSLDIPNQPPEPEQNQPSASPDTVLDSSALDSAVDELLGSIDAPPIQETPSPETTQTDQASKLNSQAPESNLGGETGGDDIMDLDALLASGDASVMPTSEQATSTNVAPNTEITPSPEVAQAIDTLNPAPATDLDNLMNLDVPPNENTPSSPATAPLDDLDALLNDTTPPEVTPPPTTSPTDDLDSILDTTNISPQPTPAELTDDLDALLAEGNPKTEETVVPAPTPMADPVVDTAPNLDDLDSFLTDTPPPDQTNEPPTPPTVDNLDALLAESPTQESIEIPTQDISAQSTPANQTSVEIPENLDATLDAPQMETAITETPIADTTQETDTQISEINIEQEPVGQSPVEEIQNIDIQKDIQEPPIEAQAVMQAPATAQMQAASVMTTIPQTITQTFMSDPGLSERLARLEADVAEIKARLHLIEKQSEPSTEYFHDLLKEGTSLHASFSSIISNSVSQALKAMPQRNDSVVSEEALQATNLIGKSLTARMDSIEKRLDDLEPNFNIEIEKAATRAIAKILREELAKMASQ